MTAHLVELRETMTTRYNELVGLGEKSERSAEEEGRIDALLAELNEIGPKLEREEKIASVATAGKRLIEPVTGMRAAAVQAAGGLATDPDMPAVDRRNLLARFLDSHELGDYRNNPKGRSDPFKVQSFFGPDGRGRLADYDARTLIYSGGVAANLTPAQILPQIYAPAPALGDNAMRSVLSVGTTTADAITYIKENSFTNASAAVAEAVSAATGAKPESALDLTEATVPIVTLAHWIPITRQALDDIGQLRSYVEGRLIDGLVRTESSQILNGNGTPPNLTGILATSGVQALDATYFTANPVQGAGTGVENYNRLLRGKTKVMTTGAANPTFYVVNPADWENLISSVNANGVFYAGGPFGLLPQERLWGLTVVISPDIAAKTALVGDGSQAMIWDRMAAQILVADQHADFFIRNIFVLLAEERIGLTVFRPGAFAKVTLV